MTEVRQIGINLNGKIIKRSPIKISWNSYRVIVNYGIIFLKGE